MFVYFNLRAYLMHSNVTIALTICGNVSLVQGLNALKSAIILSKVPLHFVLMADRNMSNSIIEMV